MPIVEVSQLPLIYRPCILDPKNHPLDCDRESCELYHEAMDLVEALAYATNRPQAEVMEMLGNPSDPTLYQIWKLAIRDYIGERAKLCKFGIPLPPREDAPPLLLDSNT